MKHPEKKDDEIYLCNADKAFYSRIDYKSKRTGKIAYDMNNKVIESSGSTHDLFPVFIKKEEFEERMKNSNLIQQEYMQSILKCNE